MPTFDNTYVMSIFMVIAITSDIYTAALFTLVYYFIDRLSHIALDEYERVIRYQNTRLDPARFSAFAVGLANAYSNATTTLPTMPIPTAPPPAPTPPVSRHAGRSRRTSSRCNSRASSVTAE